MNTIITPKVKFQLNSKLKIYPLEILSSFILITFLILPGTWNVQDLVLSNPLQAINQINLLMPLWITLCSFITSKIFSRFNVSANLLSSIFKKANGKITWTDLFGRSFFQLIGGFLATFMIYGFSILFGIWVPEVSKLGSLSPVIRGSFIYTIENSYNMSTEYWFYSIQFFICFISIVIVTTINYLIERNRFASIRKKEILRLILVYLSILITIRFSAHPVNLWRVICPSIVSTSLGGDNTLLTTLSLTSAHIVGYCYIFWFYSKKRVK